MKNALFCLAVVAMFLGSNLVFAQNQTVLPNAGFTPENPFYFFDKLSETLQRFFTFNPEGRARLEITFAKERVAEIKLILDEKGINAKGLTVAEAGLQDNLSRATAILADQKQAGKDTSSLAQEISNDFDPAKAVLQNTFKSEKDALDVKKHELKAKLKEARLAGDAARVESLSKELADLKAQKELLEQHENKNDGDIEKENKHLEEAIGLQKEAAEKIKNAEEKKAEILKEVQEKNFNVPDGAFKVFDSILLQAKTAFDVGNYEEAKRLAKEAKKNLKEVEKSFENLNEAKDKEKDLNDEEEIQQHEFEDKLKEADKEETKKIREEMKQKGEELKKKQEQSKDEQKQIEDQLEGTKNQNDKQEER